MQIQPSADGRLWHFLGQGTTSDERFLQELANGLGTIRKHLGMEVALLSEFTGGCRVFRAVDADGPTTIVSGRSDLLQGSCCQRLVEGKLPQVMHDACSVAVPGGAHLSVPVILADGSVYGTLCCYSAKPDYSLTDRDLSVMRAFAEWLGRSLDRERARNRERSLARERIEKILREGALAPVYQPIYSLADHSLAGYECLSRFAFEPNRAPDQWFAEALAVGLADELETKAIQTGLKGLPALPANVYLSVNVSPRLLAQAKFTALLDEMPANRVVIELTEHETIREYADLAAALRTLRERGLRVAVDDAGAGYSSFRHIVEIAPAIIKLDMTLTRGVHGDPARRALAAAVVRFAKDTDASVVAEGIETLPELITLRDLGVSYGQGYFLGRPQAIEETTRALTHV